ncbi:hypothetical protein [Mycobacterium uberis]|uniref:hypothetical protein n=1 Tax=Mycobacterium uberis TaxID=2162698 RepID=UPI001FB29D90|nr:hypothetical protein [Mycobacterium uberis]
MQLSTDVAVNAHRVLVRVVYEYDIKIQLQVVRAGPDRLGWEIFGVTSLGPSMIPFYLT